MQNRPASKGSANVPGFTPPIFQPIESGPKGTWYQKEGGKVVAGAYLERDIRFWAALLMSAAFVGVGIWALQNPDYEIEPMWFFLIVVGSLCLGPFIFALSLIGSVEMIFEGSNVTFIRRSFIWKSKRSFPLKAIQKVRLIPRSTTFVYVRNLRWSAAKVDLREGSGVTMELGIETAKEEFRIATDLDLNKTFYLRYVLVEMLKDDPRQDAKDGIV